MILVTLTELKTLNKVIDLKAYIGQEDEEYYVWFITPDSTEYVLSSVRKQGVVRLFKAVDGAVNVIRSLGIDRITLIII